MAKWNSSKVPLTKFRRKWNNRTVWRRWAKTSIQNVSPVLIAAKSLRIHLSILRTDFLTAKKIGTNCSQQSASPADSRSRQETDGWKPSTTTITHNASTARFARKIWRAKASMRRADGFFAKITPLSIKLCRKNLEGQSFFVKAGKPFCKSHARG